MEKQKNFMLTISLLPPMLLISSCSVERTEIARLPSPGGATIAALIRETGGGATVSATYYVYLSPAKFVASDDHPILTATYCDPTIKWLDGRTLQISYTSGCHIRQFNNLWFSESDIKNAQGPTVEIILQRAEYHNVAQS
jgi:hypothetical protein